MRIAGGASVHTQRNEQNFIYPVSSETFPRLKRPEHDNSTPPPVHRTQCLISLRKNQNQTDSVINPVAVAVTTSKQAAANRKTGRRRGALGGTASC